MNNFLGLVWLLQGIILQADMKPAWRLSVGTFRKLLFTARSKSFDWLGMLRFSDRLDKNLLLLIEKVNKNQASSG